MSLPTSGTLLPAGGGIIHAMHGGGDGTITTQSVSMLPSAGGTIHAMHGGAGSLLPTAGGTIHAMSGGDGGFIQTEKERMERIKRKVLKLFVSIISIMIKWPPFYQL